MTTKDTGIAILGATGNTGRRIATALLKAKATVTVIGRSAEKLRPLAELGARIAVADVEDPVSMRAATAGATAVYALIPPNYTTQNVVAYQNQAGKVIADALRENRIRFVVHLSSIGAELERGNGPVRGLHYQEERLNDLDAGVVHLRPTFFMENHLASIPTIKAMGILGTPLRPDVPVPIIASQDIATVATDLLTRLQFSGKAIRDLLGPRDYTLVETTAALAKSIGRPEVQYVQLEYGAAEAGLVGAGLKPDLARLYVELYRGFNEGHVRPGRPRDAASTTPTTLDEFARTIFAPAYKG